MKQTEFQGISPLRLQNHLLQHVIVIPDMDFPSYSFSRSGIRELNSLNIDVKIEGVYNLFHSRLCHLVT